MTEHIDPPQQDAVGSLLDRGVRRLVKEVKKGGVR